jgi:hypothetical protein
MENSEYNLAPSELEALSDLQAELTQVARDLNQQRIGMLRLIAKQQSLQGTVKLSEDGTKFIVEA